MVKELRDLESTAKRRSAMRRLCFGVVLVSIVLLPFVSTGADEDKTLVIGTPDNPTMLSPVAGSSYTDVVVIYRMFSSLIQANSDFSAVPDLADSWEVSEDQRTYTFHLAPNATFHDGSPVTAADVKFSILNINLIKHNVAARGYGAAIQEIETPDEHTVVFKLKAPFPEMLNPYDGVGYGCLVVPKHLYENADIETNPYNFKPIGSGPFRFVDWEPGSHVILEAYDDYFRGRPAIDRIVFRIIPDPTSMALAFEKGELDFIPSWLTASEVETLNSLPENEVWMADTPCNNNDIVAFNVRREPMNDVRVRKAIRAAIDTQKIADLIYFGTVGAAYPTTVVVSPSLFTGWWSSPNARLPEYDPAMAETLLDEAGYPRQADGWRFHINSIVPTNYPDSPKVAELVRDDLREVGIDFELVLHDYAGWADRVFVNWDFDTTTMLKCFGPNPSMLFWFHTDNIKPIPWANATGLSNSEYDDLYAEMNVELDATKRAETLHRMQEMLAVRLPVAWLVTKRDPMALKKTWLDANPEKWIWNLYLWKHFDTLQPPN